MIERVGPEIARLPYPGGAGGGTVVAADKTIDIVGYGIPAESLVQLRRVDAGTWLATCAVSEYLRADALAYVETAVGSRYAASMTSTSVATIVASGHGIVTNDLVCVYWLASGVAKYREFCTATVSGNALTLSGGAGDTLPSTGVAVTIGKYGTGTATKDIFPWLVRIVDPDYEPLRNGDSVGCDIGSFGFRYEDCGQYSLLARQDVVVAPMAFKVLVGGSSPVSIALLGPPQPGTTVRVTLSCTDAHVSFSVGYVDFTDSTWSTPQVVTISATSGVAAQVTITYATSITAGEDDEYAGRTGTLATVTTLVTSLLSKRVIPLTAGGSSSTYTITLTTGGPTDVLVTPPVGVSVGYGDGVAHTFSATTSGVTITVSAIASGTRAQSPRALAITHTATGLTLEDVQIVVTEPDASSARFAYVAFAGNR